MRRYILWCRDHPLTVLVLLTVLSILFALQARHIRLDASTQGMMIEGDPGRAIHDNMVGTFGSDNISIVFIRDEHLFTTEVLGAVEEVFYALQDLPGVSRVDSIFNATNIRGEDGYLEVNPLLDWIPDDPEELARARENALRHPVIRGEFITRDGQGIAITVVAEKREDDPDFPLRLAGEIDRIIEPLNEMVEEVFQAGLPSLRRQISSDILSDQALLVPLSVALLLVLLTAMMRSVHGAVLPMLTGGLSVLWTVGFMAWWGIPINILTTIIPSLLLVLGATEDMHLLSEYHEGLRRGASPSEAVERLSGTIGLAVMLTGATTFLGFLSISVNKITMLKQFGIASSFGLLVNPAITLSLVPVYLRFLGGTRAPRKLFRPPPSPSPSIHTASPLAAVILGLTGRRRTKVLAGLAVMVAVAAYGATELKVNNDMMGYFKPDSAIRLQGERLHQELSGVHTFSIVLDGRRENAFKDLVNLNVLYDIQRFLENDGRYDSSRSLADFLALVNREMEGGGEEHFSVPSQPAVIPQYLLLFQSRELERYVSPDYRQARIGVRHNIGSSWEFAEAEQTLREYIEGRMGDSLGLQITGEEILINHASDTMARGQATSLALMLAVIFLIVSGLFLKVQAGLMALVPTIVPVVFLFGVMGYGGISLNPGTAMIATIAVGIAIDDTIHIMVRFHGEMSRAGDQKKALAETLLAEIPPVLSTSLALSLGFAILVASNFLFLNYFGALSAMVIVVALLCDLFVSPLLLAEARLVTLWDMLSVPLRKQVLQGSQLFDGMSRWQVKKVILLARRIVVPKGECVVRQGERGETMYLILEGSASVEYAGDDGKRVSLRELHGGEFFGEIALVGETERTADVKATENATLLELDWNSLERLGKTFPGIAARFFLNISHVLGRNLADMNRRVGAKEGLLQQFRSR